MLIYGVRTAPRGKQEEARMAKSVVLKVVLSLVLATLAITRFLYYEALSPRMDLIFLSLGLSVFLVWMLPWEQLWQRLSSLSVGGVTISLQHPQVQAAIRNISIGGASEKASEKIRDRLLRRLNSLEGELQTVRGSRVLWIDDNPHEILGARRLLRALGVTITPAKSSVEAQRILEKDNDFDLIITDVQRLSTPHSTRPDAVDKGDPILGGVNFIVKLRNYKEDARIKTLPVIFYGAYSWNRLVEYTRRARELRPEAEISNAVDDFIPKVIRMLSAERENPITVSAQKTPTSPTTGEPL
jgi:CheY-like chemotaxis protein